jgi:hypothetical protein
LQPDPAVLEDELLAIGTAITLSPDEHLSKKCVTSLGTVIFGTSFPGCTLLNASLTAANNFNEK